MITLTIPATCWVLQAEDVFEPPAGADAALAFETKPHAFRKCGITTQLNDHQQLGSLVVAGSRLSRRPPRRVGVDERKVAVRHCWRDRLDTCLGPGGNNRRQTMERPELRLWTILTLFAASCGGGGDGGSASVCAPGASVACTCTNAAQGAQVCNADGSGYGACTCGGTGSAGTTGAAGASASAGTTGNGGNVASGGATATAGTTGAGGSLGAAGASGAAGTGGRAGNAGGTTGSGAAGRGGGGGVMSTGGSGGAYTGRLVSVVIIDSIVAPGMDDGTNWDGLGDVDPAITQAVAVALVGPNPAAKVLAILGDAALTNIDKPDPFGDAYVTAFGIPNAPGDLARVDFPVPNTFNPIWHAGWFFPNIPIDSDARVTIGLWDADLLDHDPIDAVQINSQDLKDALAAQQTFPVRVDDQGKHQLLFVGISVAQQQGPL